MLERANAVEAGLLKTDGGFTPAGRDLLDPNAKFDLPELGPVVDDFGA